MPFIYAGFRPFSLTDVCTRMRAHTHKDIGAATALIVRAIMKVGRVKRALPRAAPQLRRSKRCPPKGGIVFRLPR